MTLKSHGRWIVMLAMAHTKHPDYNPEWHTSILTAEQRAAQRAARERMMEVPVMTAAAMRRQLGLPET